MCYTDQVQCCSKTVFLGAVASLGGPTDSSFEVNLMMCSCTVIGVPPWGSRNESARFDLVEPPFHVRNSWVPDLNQDIGNGLRTFPHSYSS